MTAVRTVEVGDRTSGIVRFGHGLPLVWLVGPWLIEDRTLMANAAERIKKLSRKLDVPVVFRASYEVDSRASELSFLGPGLHEGLELLAWLRKEFELPVLSDVYRAEDLPAAGEVLDVIQIPALLCQQTSLVVAAARTGRAVNVRKGPFLGPDGMDVPIGKIERAQNRKILLTERGASYGYQDLVADMTAIPQMQALGYPTIFDAGHQVRRYGLANTNPIANPKELVPVLVFSAVAAGANGIFLDCHPDPDNAKCDTLGQFPLDQLEPLVDHARHLATTIRTQGHS